MFGNAVSRFGHSTLPREQLVFHSSSGGINFQLGKQGIIRELSENRALVLVTKICALEMRGD